MDEITKKNVSQIFRKWITILGYWILGIFTFGVGCCYSDTKIINSKNIVEHINEKIQLWPTFFVLINSLFFIWIFLEIREKDYSFDWGKHLKNIIYMHIIYSIAVLVGVHAVAKEWFGYSLSYSVFWIFSSLVYWKFYSLQLDTLKRLSFCILYPSILTIGVNFYFGLSMDFVKGNAFQIENVPILILMLFFFLVVLCEYFSSYRKRVILIIALVITILFTIISVIILINKKGLSKRTILIFIFGLFSMAFLACIIYLFVKKEKKTGEKSTVLFVGISLFALSVSGGIFYFSSKGNFALDFLQKPFANLLFSIAIALYLGIYEGWDALSKMNIEKTSSRFARHYRWWTFLQICYPLAFFFVITIVNSNIFTFGLIIAFTLISLCSAVVWNNGGARGGYNTEKRYRWAWWKMIFGGVTMTVMYFNKIWFMEPDFALNSCPAIDTEDINVELIIFLLGGVSSFFITESNKKKNTAMLLLAVPFNKDVQMENFTHFCKDGYFYDFTNYVYLIYIIVIHILIFNTELIAPPSENRESIIKIFILFSVIIYMLFSFICKFASSEKVHGKP